MDSIRKKVSNFTLKLQAQTHLPLWALANEQLIYSAAMNKCPAWGPKMQLLYRIMAVTYKIKVSDMLIFCVGFCRAISIWWYVKKNSFKTRKENEFKNVFAGFGASSEEYLYLQHSNQSQGPLLRINWVTHEGLAKLGC